MADLRRTDLTGYCLSLRWSRWLAIFLSSLLVTLSLSVSSLAISTPKLQQTLPAGIVEADAAIEGVQNLQIASLQLALTDAHSSITAGITADITAGITAGISAFENGRFVEAIAHWQAHLDALDPADTSTALTRAYLLSNLSSAYQHLGQLDQAQQTLRESLEIVHAQPNHSQAYWEVLARVLNTQGQSQWQQGQTQQALDTWQAAEQAYRQASESTAGLILAQVNQALALQELGFNARAIGQLSRLTQQLPALDSAMQPGVVTALSQGLRRVGDLSAAESLLTSVLGESLFSETTAPATGINFSGVSFSGVSFSGVSFSTGAVKSFQLELAHTLRSQSHRAIAIGQQTTATDYADKALAYYIAASQPASQPASQSQPLHSLLLNRQAQLNQLSYLIEIGQLEAAQALWPSIDLSGLPLSRDSVEAYISYAHSLNCLRAPTSTACTKQVWQEYSRQAPLIAAAQPQDSQAALTEALTAALGQARTLSDPLIESYAVGELGHAYEITGQRDEAIRLTQQALNLLEGKSLPEAAYRWEWQLGRLYQLQPATLTQASAAYQRAIASLSVVRQNLLLIDPQAQFSFRDDVEPIYRECINLLLYPSSANADLKQAATESATDGSAGLSPRAPTQAALRLAVQTLDALQLTELENFLGCNLAQLVSLSTDSSDPKAAKIYPMILPDRLAIIVDIEDQPLTLTTVAVDQPTIEQAIAALRDSLTLPGKTPDVLAAAQQLYGWLIEPIEPILAERPQLETLVFVPDGSLRNVPMGVLYDGQQYLVEKDYAIAVAPQLDLFAPRPSPAALKVLRGGIGLPQTVRGQQFPPIERIQTELDQIPPELTVSQPLLNEAFTQANIEHQLATETYSAIHWKTHGVFSSNPGETFLVAYQDGITANELSTLVRSASEQQAEPLELLVLSACATAQGDRRAVLGLAGIAVRAGTRSTLSTLWRADDGANTELMASFYQGLQQGQPKAQALQQAQRDLLRAGGYPAPYYWAPYVLVGNWL